MLGAKRDSDTGLFHWEKSGKVVNMSLFKDKEFGDGQAERAVARKGNPEFQAWLRNDVKNVVVICEAPSKFAKHLAKHVSSTKHPE